MANARGLPDVIASQPDMQNLPEHLQEVARDLKRIENSTDIDWKTYKYSEIIPQLNMQDAFALAVYFMQHHLENLNGTNKDKEQYNVIRVRSLTKELYRAVANKLDYDPTNAAIDIPHEMNVLNRYVYLNAPKSDTVSQESNAVGNIYFCVANDSSSTWLHSLNEQQLMARFQGAAEYELPDNEKRLKDFQVKFLAKRLDVNEDNREGHFKKLIWEIEKWRAQHEDTLKNHILNVSVVGQKQSREEVKKTEIITAKVSDVLREIDAEINRIKKSSVNPFMRSGAAKVHALEQLKKMINSNNGKKRLSQVMEMWGGKYEEVIDQQRNRFKNDKNPSHTSLRDFTSNFLDVIKSKYTSAGRGNEEKQNQTPKKIGFFEGVLKVRISLPKTSSPKKDAKDIKNDRSPRHGKRRN
jgi:hypothetical protein